MEISYERRKTIENEFLEQIFVLWDGKVKMGNYSIYLRDFKEKLSKDNLEKMEFSGTIVVDKSKLSKECLEDELILKPIEVPYPEKKTDIEVDFDNHRVVHRTHTRGIEAHLKLKEIRETEKKIIFDLNGNLLEYMRTEIDKVEEAENMDKGYMGQGFKIDLT